MTVFLQHEQHVQLEPKSGAIYCVTLPLDLLRRHHSTYSGGLRRLVLLVQV